MTTEDDNKLDATLRGWTVPPASPWLGARIAAQVSARRAQGFSLFPGPLKVRVAALAMAVVVGWGVGAFVSAPEAAADDGSIELTDLW